MYYRPIAPICVIVAKIACLSPTLPFLLGGWFRNEALRSSTWCVWVERSLAGKAQGAPA